MVNEMQKRRDDDLRVQAQLKLPVDAARRQKRATTSFRSATKIDSLKSSQSAILCLILFIPI